VLLCRVGQQPLVTQLLPPPTEFRITESFKVSGVGTVVAGTVYRGVIRIGSMLMLGPDGFGGFRPVVVRSIHNHHIPVSEVCAGQEATFCLRMLDGDKVVVFWCHVGLWQPR
jgi:GTPase